MLDCEQAPMASSPIHKLTEEQYLALDSAAEIKSEFLDGEMFAMSGGTAAHSRLQRDLLVELTSHLGDGPCEVFTADLRIRVNRTRLYTYPDVSVVCEKAIFADGASDTLLNPAVVFEILSPSTEFHDRGRKFQHYREAEILKDYIMVSQDSVRVEQYTRQNDGTWTLRDHVNLEAELKIESINVAIPLARIYHRVTFDAPAQSE